MSTADETQAEGQYESKRESDLSRVAKVKRLLSEIELASSTERDWRIEAQKAIDIYRAEKEGEGQRFNIVFSNVQTSCPSLYNSTPSPDVRTRYSSDDEVARVSGQAIERVLSYSADQYSFDDVIKGCVQDRELPGRGQARVRYAPYTYQGKTYQEVNSEHVPWKHYLQGPALTFPDVPWVAFEHFLTREQLMQLSPERGGSIELDYSITGNDKQKADDAPNVYKRARVWEYWEKATRKVYWLAASYKADTIREDDDPLGLIGFFPVPSPLYAIKTTGTMVPVCPYRIIFPLVEELEEITVRIQALIRVCKWRGIRHPAIPSFERLEEAVDGELIAPLDGGDLLGLIQAGGLDKYIWLMPVDQIVKVLQQLYTQREQIKQTIFEVSGLADIMRGQSDPNETLGAQEIKANFGTMRLQDAQKDVQRFCRDIFRLKAEIACNMFDSQNLAMMTGLNLPSRQDVMGAKSRLQQIQQMAANAPQLPPQGQQGAPGQPMPMGAGAPPAPPQPSPEDMELADKVSWEDVLETLKSGVMRSYRIDIETDSTILGDTKQNQQTASAFLDGTGKFMQSVAPMVQVGAMTMDVAIDLYSSIVRRSFKLGKQAEDALARWAHEAEKKAKNPQPQPPSPEEVKAQMAMQQMQAQMQMDQQKHGMDMEALQAKSAAAQQATQAKAAADQQSLQIEMGVKQQDHQIDAAKMQMETQANQQTAYQAFALQQEQARQEMMNAQREAAIEEYMARRRAAHEDESMARDSYYGERQAQMAERMAAQKHEQAMAQAKAKASQQARPN